LAPFLFILVRASIGKAFVFKFSYCFFSTDVVACRGLSSALFLLFPFSLCHSLYLSSAVHLITHAISDDKRHMLEPFSLSLSLSSSSSSFFFLFFSENTVNQFSKFVLLRRFCPHNKGRRGGRRIIFFSDNSENIIFGRGWPVKLIFKVA